LTKAALAYIPPITLLLIQLLASLALLWPALLWQRTTVPWGRRLLPLALLGLLDPGLSYVLSLMGLSLSKVSLSALLWATEPLMIVALAWFLLRERPPSSFLWLSGVAVLGAALIVGDGLSQPGLLLGNVLILSGVVCCSLYTVLSRPLVENFSAPLALALQESLAVGMVLLIWPAELSRPLLDGLARLPAAVWGLAALGGVTYYGLAFWFYLAGLRHVTAGEAGFFINLVPIFALAGAYLALGETLSLAQWLGCALVLLSVFSLSARPARQSAEAAPS
jgi:drug/metabolite transporter (DMT)-like permease